MLKKVVLSLTDYTTLVNGAVEELDSINIFLSHEPFPHPPHPFTTIFSRLRICAGFNGPTAAQ